MLDAQDFKGKFSTFHEYEAFCMEWAEACYILNPTEKNKKELERSKTIAEVLRLQKEVEKSG